MIRAISSAIERSVLRNSSKAMGSRVVVIRSLLLPRSEGLAPTLLAPDRLVASRIAILDDGHHFGNHCSSHRPRPALRQRDEVSQLSKVMPPARRLGTLS